MSQGGFTFRYALPTLLGVPLALGYILPRLKRSSIAAILTFLLFAVVVREGLFWLSYIGHPGSGEAEADSIERLVAAAGHPELPVVVSARPNNFCRWPTTPNQTGRIVSRALWTRRRPSHIHA